MSSPSFGPDERLLPMRVQRFLARAGVASRRGSENLMSAGRVCVNGEVVRELGSKVDPRVDTVTVDGVPVHLAAGPVYLMLNKPVNCLTTMSDPQGRRCVADVMPCDKYPGLFPVGRLDRDTTGLLLFTTDGDLGQMLLHPSHHVWKTYIAVVDGTMTDADLEPLRSGIVLDDGPCQPARCRVLGDAECVEAFGRRVPKGATCVEVQIREGRKNQVKRMLSRLHHPVIMLHRSRFGNLELGELAAGSFRSLTDRELSYLKGSIVA